MMHRRRWPRILLRVVVGLVIVLVVLLLALRWFLSSHYATDLVAEHLEKMLNSPVRVQSVTIGVTGNSTLHGLEVFEPAENGKAATAPWLVADTVQANLSLLGILRHHASPSEIDFSGAKLDLHFNSDGDLVTRLPKSKHVSGQLPRVRISNSQVTLTQDLPKISAQDAATYPHKGPIPKETVMVVHGVNGDFSRIPKGLQVDATANDPEWGEWRLRATSETETGKVEAHLDTVHPVKATMAKLESIPFIAPGVWEEVWLEGTTPAQLHIEYDPERKKDPVRFKLVLHPTDTRVYVPSIELAAGAAHGEVVIVNDLVELRKVEGQLVKLSPHDSKPIDLHDLLTGTLTNGAISLGADLDFRGKVTRMHYEVEVQKVPLDDLVLLDTWPKARKIKQTFNGRLQGTANIDIDTYKGKVKTQGLVEGVIKPVWMRGDPTRTSIGKIGFTLHANDRGGFDFEQDKQVSRALPMGEPGASATGGLLRSLTLPARQILLLTCLLQAGPALEDPPPAPKEDDASDLQPLPLLKKIPEGAHALGQGALHASRAALRPLTGRKAAPGAAAAPGAPSNLDINLSLDNVDLAALLRHLEVKLPVPVAGRASLKVKASIPYEEPHNLKAYKADGTAHFSRLEVNGVVVTSVDAHLSLDKGVLDLTNLKGRVPVPGEPDAFGTFEGRARYQVQPAGALDANLGVDRLPVALVLAPILKNARTAAGTVSGSVKLNVPAGRLDDPSAWDGSVALKSGLLDISGVSLRDVVLGLTLAKGEADLSDLKAVVAGAPVTGSGTIRLKGDYPFKGRVSMKQASLTALEKLVPGIEMPFPVKGIVTLGARAEGTLRPFALTVGTGTLSATDLNVNGILIDSVSTDWTKEPNDLKLSDLKARLYKGSITGSAVVPFNARGPASANLDVQNVDVAALATASPVKIPVKVQGQVSGTVKGKLGAAPPGKPRPGTAALALTAPRLTVEGIPTQRLRANIDYKEGAATFDLRGDTLGGRFQLNGRLPAAPAAEPPPPPPAAPAAPRPPPGAEGRLRVQGVRLGRLFQALHLDRLASFNGTVYINLPFHFETARRIPVGAGRFEVDNISYADVDVADRLAGDLILREDTIQLQNINGTLGEGMVTASIVYNLRNRERSWFTLNMDNVDARRALLPFPEVAKRITGFLSARLRGRLGREWRGDGDVSLTRGSLLGIEVGEWHFPLVFSFTPREGNGEVSVHDSRAQIGQGRATARGQVFWGAGLRLSGSLHLFDAPLRSLFRNAGSLSSYASGRVSAVIDFSGSEMHSLNDLNATVRATLRQAQALQLPILQAIAPYILRGRASITSFTQGELRGRLARGIFRIQSFTLTSSLLQLIIQGNVTMTGRLDLDVYVRVNSNLRNACTALSIAAIPVAGPIPFLVASRATSVLASSLVHLRVTGTIQSPYVHFEPVRLLTEEAIRFFLLGAAFPGT